MIEKFLDYARDLRVRGKYFTEFTFSDVVNCKVDDSKLKDFEEISKNFKGKPKIDNGIKLRKRIIDLEFDFINNCMITNEKFIKSELWELEHSAIIEYMIADQEKYFIAQDGSGKCYFLRRIRDVFINEIRESTQKYSKLEQDNSPKIISNVARTFALSDSRILKLTGWVKIKISGDQTNLPPKPEIQPYTIYYAYDYAPETLDFYLAKEKFEKQRKSLQELISNFKVGFMTEFTFGIVETLRFLHLKNMYYHSSAVFVVNHKPVLGFIGKFADFSINDTDHRLYIEMDYLFAFQIYTKICTELNIFELDFDLEIRKKLMMK